MATLEQVQALADSPAVLVVSPDDGVREVLSRLLTPHGLRIFGAHGDEAAVDAVRRTSADVVLVSSECDDRVLEQLVKEHFDPFVPVLLFTPDADLPHLRQLAARHEVPMLELTEDMDGVVLRVRAAAGRQLLS
jgi:DNA-binding NtrC family response regulator